jgi:hypothetical protein
VARWACGAKWAKGPSAAGPVCHTVGTHLERVVRPHCAGAPAPFWHQDLAAEDFLLLGSKVRVQLTAVRPVIAAAAVHEQAADCWPAATPRTRKKRCWKWRLAATRNAPSLGTLLSKLRCVHRSTPPRFIASGSSFSEKQPTDLTS